MGNRSSSRSYSHETAVTVYDRQAARQARTHDKSDFTDPIFLVHHLRPGDLVQKKGDFTLHDIQEWFYSHWAVYIGNGDIVHVKKFDDGRIKIWREDMVAAFNGKSVRKNNHMDEYYEPKRVQEIVQRARRSVGDRWDYSFLTNNCEHFASSCRYGVKISLQSFGIFDVLKGNVSLSDYMRYHMKPVKERCATFFSWIKRKIVPALEGAVLNAIGY